MEPGFDPGAIKVFIFDVNGVLVDSNRANADAMGEAFTGDPDLRRRIAGLYLELTGIDRGTKIRTIQEKLIGKPFAEGEFELRWDNFRRLGRSSMSGAPLVEGCREVLAELGRRKQLRAALSNTPEAELLEILTARGLRPLLDIVRGGGNRPKSESLSDFLAEFGFDPRTCVFLGDGKGDLAAARHSGVPFFGIDPGVGEFRGENDLLGRFRDLAEWGRLVLGMDLE
ncbi:MAG: HAD family hydrolase [Syntrophobacteraceae bacterium]